MKYTIACNLLLSAATNAQSSSWATLDGAPIANTGFSNSVSKRSYNDNFMIAFGDPNLEGVTTAWTGAQGSYITREIAVEQTGSQFGHDVQVAQRQSSDGFVAIGAPSYKNGTVAVGAASVYKMGSDGTIEKRGETIVGPSFDDGSAGFGTSLSFLDNESELVVCNPNDKTLATTTPHGRCFLYWYTILDDDNAWAWIPSPFVDTALNDYVGEEGDEFGHDVAGDCCIGTNDFSSRYFIVGAPGSRNGRGKARVVGLKDPNGENRYERYMEIAGASDGDRCGTSVSANGGYVAIGCPGAGDAYNGLVRVFELSTQQEVGTSGISGLAGEKLGGLNTMDVIHSYQNSDSLIQSLKVIVTTSAGIIKHYSYFNDEWIENEEPYDAGGPVRVSGGPYSYSDSYISVSAPNLSGNSLILAHTFLTDTPTTSPTPPPSVPPTLLPTKAAIAEPTTMPFTVAPSTSGGESASGRFVGVAIVASTMMAWILNA